MALQKTIVQNNGITTSYHKIRKVILIDDNGSYGTTEKISLRINVVVISYVNEEYRITSNAVKTETYDFTITDEEELIPIRQLGYEKLKTLDIFKDAIDC